MPDANGIVEVSRDSHAHYRHHEGTRLVVKAPWGESSNDFAVNYTLGYHIALKDVERAVREELSKGLDWPAALDAALSRLDGQPPEQIVPVPAPEATA